MFGLHLFCSLTVPPCSPASLYLHLFGPSVQPRSCVKNLMRYNDPTEAPFSVAVACRNRSHHHGDLFCCFYTCSLKRQPAAVYNLQHKAAVSRYRSLRGSKPLHAASFSTLHNKPCAVKWRLLFLKSSLSHEWIQGLSMLHTVSFGLGYIIWMWCYFATSGSVCVIMKSWLRGKIRQRIAAALTK